MAAELSVAEAARLLDWSESTVRRHVGDRLVSVTGAAPLRITAESVEQERERALSRLGIPQSRMAADLADDNRRLREAVNDLRMALSLLLDAVGRFAETGIPNH